MTGRDLIQQERAAAGPFYVYLLSLPDGTPCYVGKGKDGRMDEHERYRTHNSELKMIIATLKEKGESLIKSKLHEGLAEEIAYELEAQEIFRIGRKQFGIGPLVNRSDGGWAPTNIVFTEERRKKNGAAKRGIKLSEAHKEKIRIAMIGRKMKPESIRVTAEKQRGKKKVWREGSYERWLELQRKNNPGFTGYRHSEETRAKIRAARAKQVNVVGGFKPGYQPTEEVRARLSAAVKASWVKRRAAQVAAV